ncbi:arylsulfatase [Phycisphaeraceae bacterium D3-23]
MLMDGCRLAVCFALALVLAAAAAAQDTPNVIIIYADDIGYGDFGCYGGTIPTPNVDALAEQGLRFTNGYCPSATCTPSRFAMLTGMYAFRQQGTGIARGDAAMVIAPGSPTVASLMQDAGYVTGVVGKWHLGLGSRQDPVDWNGEITPAPLDIGFDYQFIMAATGDRVPCVYIEGRHVVGLDPDDPIRVRYGGQNFPGEPDGRRDRDTLVMDWSHGHNAAVVNRVGRIGYMTGGAAALWDDEAMADDFTTKALDFIEDNQDAPFFLYFATHDNHVPRLPHPRFAGVSGQGPRGDSIVQFDWCVGQVMQKLETLGLTEDTLIILTSDNGPVLDDGYKDQANELLGDHTPSGPLRGGKYSLFEGGTRVPFIVSWPGTVEPGVSDALVSQVDFGASFAAMTGQTLEAVQCPDSADVLAALLGRSEIGRDHIIEHAGRIAIRIGHWKYIPPGRTREGLGPWRRAELPEPGGLYNLAEDPGETTNLADEHPDRVRTMRERLEAIREAPVAR